MIDKEKIRQLTESEANQSAVFMVISNDETKEKSEVNFKNIIAGGDGPSVEKKDELAKQVSQRKFVM